MSSSSSSSSSSGGFGDLPLRDRSTTGPSSSSTTQPDEGGGRGGQGRWKVELSGGALAGLISCVAFYPLESVEARVQVGQLAASTAAAAGAATAITGGGGGGGGGGRHRRPLLVGLVAEVGRTHGAAGLYRGMVPSATGTLLNWALYFTFYDGLRRHMPSLLLSSSSSSSCHTREAQGKKRRPDVRIDLLAAAISGSVCAVLVNPFWVLKLHQITATATQGSTSLVASFRHLVSTQGYGGLWRGTLISILGVADGALQLATYDQLKYWLSNEHNVLPSWAQLLAGGCSRGVALAVTYPYQLLRSVLQQQNCPYSGALDALRQIVRTEGLRGLYKGIGLNLTRSIPPAACMFFVLEQFRLAFSAI